MQADVFQHVVNQRKKSKIFCLEAKIPTTAKAQRSKGKYHTLRAFMRATKIILIVFFK